MDENTQHEKLNDTEIQSRLAAMKKTERNRLTVTIVLFLVVVCFGISAVIIQNNGELPNIWWVSLLIVFAATIVFFFLTAAAGRKTKAFVSENVTRGLLEEVFEVDEYIHNAHISAELIHNAGLMGEWDRMSGSDLVRGKYKGHKIMFSDIKLEKQETRRNSDGETETYYDTVFHGQWYFIEHSRLLNAALRLREKASIFSGVIKSDIETENAAFNDRFQIITTDGHTAFLVLTPHFMEYITSADAKAAGQTYISFAGNRTCIAVYNKRDLFESSADNLDDLKARQRGDIRYITAIWDELMRNDYLFGGDNPVEDIPGSLDASAPVAEAAVTDWVRLAEVESDGEERPGILRGLNPVGLLLLAVYAVSAVYTLIALPYGIVLSTDIYSADAISVPTPMYIIVLSIIVIVFCAPLLTLRVRGTRAGFLGGLLRVKRAVPSIIGTLLLLLFHLLFVAANVGG